MNIVKRVTVFFAIALAFGIAFTGCDISGGGDGGYIPSALAAKWYYTQAEADLGTGVPILEFTLGGKCIYEGDDDETTVRVNRGVITFLVDNVEAGKASYNISGTELTIYNADNEDIGTFEGTYYKKASGSGGGGSGSGKTLTVTGLNGYNGAPVQVGLFKSLDDFDIFAVPDVWGGGEVANNRAVLSLYQDEDEPWTGSGAWYVGLLIKSFDEIPFGEAWVRSRSVSFNSSQTVAFNSFERRMISFTIQELAEMMGVDLGGEKELTLNEIIDFAYEGETDYDGLMDSAGGPLFFYDSEHSDPIGGNDTLEISITLYSPYVPFFGYEENEGGGGDEPGFHPSGVTALSAGTWANGSITSGGAEAWYSINVSSGQTYYLWWNDSYDGDDTKELDIEVYAWTGNGNQVSLSENDSAWTSPCQYYATAAGTLYLCVRAWSGDSSTGTFAIAYSTSNSRPGEGSTGPSIVPVLLTANTWANGNITTSGGEDWYSINVTSGQAYYIWWNDSDQGDGTKTLDAEVSGSYSIGGATVFNNEDSAWNSPKIVVATASGTLYLRVRAYNGGSSTGTYAIVYSTSNTRPGSSGSSIVPVPLTVNTWKDGIITSSGVADWYSISVTSGQTYYIWWNDSYEGNDSKTLDVDVSASSAIGETDIFSPVDSGWANSKSFTAGSGGTVYLRVRAYGGGGSTGTYAVAYSTTNTRPGGTGTDIVPIPLSANIWANGSIDTPYSADWYSINVTSGQTYYIWWNDSYYSDGDGTKTLDVDVSASSVIGGTDIFSNVDSGWVTPRSFTPDSNGTVYLRVRAYSGYDNTGTYAIVYSTSNTRPGGSTGPDVVPIALTANTWANGNIANSGDEDWYSINVISGQTYYIWWNDSYDGDGTQTLDAAVSASYSIGGDFIFEDEDAAWETPIIVDATANGTLYIRVCGYNYLFFIDTGTYAIAYSTVNTRP